MINLLPEREKNSVEKEYYRRIVVAAGIFIFFAICIAVITLLPSYFLLISQENTLNSRIDTLEKELVRENAGNIESTVKNLNSDLVFLDNQENSLRKIAPLIKNILESRSASIKLKSVVYQKNSDGEDIISLGGKALTRNSFISFVNEIEKIKEVKEVNSPPANILKGENLLFNMAIKFSSTLFKNK